MNEAQAARAFPVEYAKSPPCQTYHPEVIQRLVNKYMKLSYILVKIIGWGGLGY